MTSLQTFGSYGANFHPHVHALITEGVFHDPRSAAPSFELVVGWDLAAVLLKGEPRLECQAGSSLPWLGRNSRSVRGLGSTDDGRG